MSDKLILTDEIIFDSKPDAVPYNYRISYKIAQVCLIISICSGKKSCSYLKLHMIAMGLCNEKEMKRLKQFCRNDMLLYTLVRFDPAVTRAVRFAVADGLIKQLVIGSLQLTSKGKEYVKMIQADKELLTREKEFLNDISNSLTEEKIQRLIDIWGNTDASNK